MAPSAGFRSGDAPQRPSRVPKSIGSWRLCDGCSPWESGTADCCHARGSNCSQNVQRERDSSKETWIPSVAIFPLTFSLSFVSPLSSAGVSPRRSASNGIGWTSPVGRVRLHSGTTKNGDPRIFPMTLELRDLLKREEAAKTSAERDADQSAAHAARPGTERHSHVRSQGRSGSCPNPRPSRKPTSVPCACGLMDSV